jgi:hypothetical protein
LDFLGEGGCVEFCDFELGLGEDATFGWYVEDADGSCFVPGEVFLRKTPFLRDLGELCCSFCSCFGLPVYCCVGHDRRMLTLISNGRVQIKGDRLTLGAYGAIVLKQ